MARLALALVALLAIVVTASSLHAQADENELPLGKRLEQYGKLQQQLLPLFNQKEYEQAADICREQMKLVPEADEPHYNLGCALARLGHKEIAIFELSRAVDLGFTDVAHMREDEDLASLHEDEKFKEMLKAIRDKELAAPHENAAEIDSLKTIENFPEGGLRYRLRIDPRADAKKPARLLIWLHPSGGSMDNTVEEMSPKFARDGYALLVFTQKNYNFWSEQDVNALMEKTLPDVARIEGVDAKKPILLGFSAGGQLALQLWEHKPADFGGLVLDAAYPLDEHQLAIGKVEPLTLPKDDAIKACPILALVGADDRGLAVWKQVDSSWRDAHVPLSVHIIPGRGHAWLFDKTESASLHEWLKNVAAGQLPSEAPAVKHPPLGEQDNPPIKVIYTP